MQNGTAILQWQSGVESNFKGFELEKSTVINNGDSRPGGNGEDFVTLVTIPAKGSNSSYTYSIAQPEKIAYYRLKIVDNDGSSKYSKIIQLSQTGSSNKVRIYPNPAHSYINVEVANAGSIFIYDALGRPVKTQALQADLNRINIIELSKGIYYSVVDGVKISFVKE